MAHGCFIDIKKFGAIGHLRLLDFIKIQCFKSASQLCMLDLVFIDELCDVDQTALIRMRTFSLTLCQTHRKKINADSL